MITAPKQMIKIGIDLGGTKTEVIALDDNSNEFFRKRVPTPNDCYQAIIDTICNLVNAAETTLGQKGLVGIGTPGTISSTTGRMKNSNTQVLLNQALKQDLERALRRPIKLANDANCFILSEATDGAARNASVAFGVIIGTGTGGGISVNKTLVEGQNSIAGEWGHNPLPWPQAQDKPAQRCYCGKHGCIETYLSGPGFMKQNGFAENDVQKIVEQYNAGQPTAIRAFERYFDQMARAFASIINVLDPNVIVLGGGMSNIDFLYNNVSERLEQYVFSDKITTQLLRPQHGNSSGVRGAAWLWDNN